MPDAPPPRKKSEQRQRQQPPLQVRMDAQEWAILRQRAEQAGLSVPDYVRVSCLAGKPLRKVRQRTPERVLLVKIETALNRIGSNVNQLAAKANSAGFLTRRERDELKALVAQAHQLVEGLLPSNDDDYQGE